MLPFEQADPKHNLITGLRSEGEGGGDISSAREAQAFGFLITLLDDGQGEQCVQKSAVLPSVSTAPLFFLGTGLQEGG